MRADALREVALRIVIIATLVAGWHLSTDQLSGATALAFPSPRQVLQILTTHWLVFAEASVLTSARVAVGVVIGSMIGFWAALTCARFPTIFRFFNPVVEIIRPIPPIALTPFFIFWFGLGNAGQIGLIALGSFMIIFVATTGSIRNLDPIYERALFALGGTRSDLVSLVWTPASLPEVSSAIRVTLATAFALSVAAEYLGAQGGLGFVIRNARTTLDTPAILVAAMFLGLLSYGFDLAARAVMIRMTDWLPRSGRSHDERASNLTP